MLSGGSRLKASFSLNFWEGLGTKGQTPYVIQPQETLDTKGPGELPYLATVLHTRSGGSSTGRSFVLGFRSAHPFLGQFEHVSFRYNKTVTSVLSRVL